MTIDYRVTCKLEGRTVPEIHELRLYTRNTDPGYPGDVRFGRTGRAIDARLVKCPVRVKCVDGSTDSVAVYKLADRVRV
jgi:hypothetical protein